MLEVIRNFPGAGNLSWESKTSAIKDQPEGMKETDPLKPFHELAGGKSFPSLPEQYKDIKGDIENPLKLPKKDKDLDGVVGDFIEPEKPPETTSILTRPPEPASDLTARQIPQSASETTGQTGDTPRETPAGETPPEDRSQGTRAETPAAEGSGPQTQRDEISVLPERRAGQQAESSQRTAGTEEKPPETSSSGIRRPAGMAHRAERPEQPQGEKPPETHAGTTVPAEQSTRNTNTGEQSTAPVPPGTTRRPAGRSQRATTGQQRESPQTENPPERSIVQTASQDFSTRGTGSQISTPERTVNTSDVTTTSSATRSRVTQSGIEGAAEANRQRDRSAWTSVGPVQLSTTISTRQEASASGRGSLPSDSSPGGASGDAAAGLSGERRVAARYRGITATHTTYIRDDVSVRGQANLDPQRIRSLESPVEVDRAQVEGRVRMGEERRVDLPGGSFFRVRSEYDQGAGIDIEDTRTDTSQGRNWNDSRRESLQGSIDAGLSQTIEGRTSSGSGLSMSLRGTAGVGEGGAFERGISRDERGIHLQIGGAIPVKTPFGADGRLRVDISQQDIERARAVADRANTVIDGVHTGVATGVHRASEMAGDVRDDINRGARRVGHRIEAARDRIGNWISGDD
ncbi:MAG: hypothetical protein ABRQ39_12160 [Candidatus Eremiobacterota bacterium]